MTRTSASQDDSQTAFSRWSRIISLLILIVTSTTALFKCPHSKVEESFNIQATHDLYYYGISPAWKSSWGSSSSVQRMDGGGNEIDQHDAEKDELPYDHLKYPGVVPRTFAGPLILSTIAHIITIVLSPLVNIFDRPMVVQSLSRLILLFFNIYALWRMACASDRKFGSSSASTTTTTTIKGKASFVGTYFLLITACQFHLPYYGSRMLPNVMALPFVVHSYAYWFDGNITLASSLLVIAAAIFRCDIIILLFTVGLCMLLRREMTIPQALMIGITSGVLALLMTVPFDSMLWKRIVWPEGEVLFFNTVENKSSEWGRSPWHWYGTRALPRAMLCTAFLVPLSFIRLPEYIAIWEWEWRRKRQLRSSKDQKPSSFLPKMFPENMELIDVRILAYLIPMFSFVALYSFLPHKEMRFVFPALPMLNIAAAIGLARLHEMAFSPSFPIVQGKDKEDQILKAVENEDGIVSYTTRFLFACGILAVSFTFIGSCVFLIVSQHNYPGGAALEMMKKHVEQQLVMGEVQKSKEQKNIRVYIDVASSMSGVSLFGQRSTSISTVSEKNAAKWSFEKSGYEEENQFDENQLASKDITHCLTENKGGLTGFHVVNVAYGAPRLDFRKLRLNTEESIYILEKDDWRQ